MAVRALLREGLKPPVLVFVQSKDRASQLFRELIFDGVQVDAIHSDRTAAARAKAVDRFRTGQIWVLIATDLLSRGLDFLSVNTVINYDMPSSATAYVHRIGRTGRNGRKGCAITLFTEEDRSLVGAVAKVAHASGAEVPAWLLNVGSNVRKDELKRLESRPPKRKQVGGPNRASLKGGRRKKLRVGNGDGRDDSNPVQENPAEAGAGDGDVAVSAGIGGGAGDERTGGDVNGAEVGQEGAGVGGKPEKKRKKRKSKKITGVEENEM